MIAGELLWIADHVTPHGWDDYRDGDLAVPAAALLECAGGQLGAGDSAVPFREGRAAVGVPRGDVHQRPVSTHAILQLRVLYRPY